MKDIINFLILAILTGVISVVVAYYLERGESEAEALKLVPKEPIRYDYTLDNIHDVKNQYIETTFHNYMVIVDNGKVVDNGVIHLFNCKCRTNEKK